MSAVQFLVRAQVTIPPDMPPNERARLILLETARGRELIAMGKLRRIWRVPGRWANIALYEAIDATELHALVSSLPLWPWMDVAVEALATHPLEAGDSASSGDDEVLGA
jgi:muconolactone D-isomerase